MKTNWLWQRLTYTCKAQPLVRFQMKRENLNSQKKLKEGDVLLFSFVGLETQQYVVPANAPETIEIQITLLNSVMMGEIVVNEMYTKQPNSAQRFWNKVKSIF